MPLVRSQEMGNGQRVPSLLTPAKRHLFLFTNFTTMLFHENTNGCNVKGVLLPFQPTLKLHRSYNRVNWTARLRSRECWAKCGRVLLQGSFWYFQTERGKKERESHCEVLYSTVGIVNNTVKPEELKRLARLLPPPTCCCRLLLVCGEPSSPCVCAHTHTHLYSSEWELMQFYYFSLLSPESYSGKPSQLR